MAEKTNTNSECRVRHLWRRRSVGVVLATTIFSGKGRILAYVESHVPTWMNISDESKLTLEAEAEKLVWHIHHVMEHGLVEHTLNGLNDLKQDPED